MATRTWRPKKGVYLATVIPEKYTKNPAHPAIDFSVAEIEKEYENGGDLIRGRPVTAEHDTDMQTCGIVLGSRILPNGSVEVAFRLLDENPVIEALVADEIARGDLPCVSLEHETLPVKDKNGGTVYVKTVSGVSLVRTPGRDGSSIVRSERITNDQTEWLAKINTSDQSLPVFSTSEAKVLARLTNVIRAENMAAAPPAEAPVAAPQPDAGEEIIQLTAKEYKAMMETQERLTKHVAAQQARELEAKVEKFVQDTYASMNDAMGQPVLSGSDPTVQSGASAIKFALQRSLQKFEQANPGSSVNDALTAVTAADKEVKDSIVKKTAEVPVAERPDKLPEIVNEAYTAAAVAHPYVADQLTACANLANYAALKERLRQLMDEKSKAQTQSAPAARIAAESSTLSAQARARVRAEAERSVGDSFKKEAAAITGGQAPAAPTAAFEWNERTALMSYLGSSASDISVAANRSSYNAAIQAHAAEAAPAASSAGSAPARDDIEIPSYLKPGWMLSSGATRVHNAHQGLTNYIAEKMQGSIVRSNDFYA